MAYAPHLTEAQIDRIRVYAKPRQVVAGEILYEPGLDTPPVYVVISGCNKDRRHRGERRAYRNDLPIGAVFRRVAHDLRPALDLSLPGGRRRDSARIVLPAICELSSPRMRNSVTSS